jgi:hypothetical protein
MIRMIPKKKQQNLPIPKLWNELGLAQLKEHCRAWLPSLQKGSNGPHPRRTTF